MEERCGSADGVHHHTDLFLDSLPVFGRATVFRLKDGVCDAWELAACIQIEHAWRKDQVSGIETKVKISQHKNMFENIIL